MSSEADLGYVVLLRSFFAMGVCRQVGCTAAMVLLAIRSHADNADGTSWPSNKRLAEMVGKREATIKSALSTLEAAGLLTREGAGPARRLLTHDEIQIGNQVVGWAHRPADFGRQRKRIRSALDRGLPLGQVDSVRLIRTVERAGATTTALEVTGLSAHESAMLAIDRILGTE